MIEIPFVGQSYQVSEIDVSAQRTVNLYLEVYDDGKVKTPMSLKATPGLLRGATMSYGANKMRCLYQTSTSRLFAVRGNGVAEFSTALAETSRFTLTTGLTAPSSNIVKMADNGVQMLVSDGSSSGYTYDLSTDTATLITDVDYPAATFCGIIDGFYLANVPNSTLVRYSAVDNPTSWSSLSSMSKEGSSDFVNSFIVSNRKIWIFGKQSYEVFYNTGDSNNQFLRMEGTYHLIGNEAPYSLAEDGESVFWLGGNAQGFGQIYRSVQGGFDAIPISTKPIEQAIHGYSTSSDAEGFCYQQEGNSFYKLNFPTANKTWVYNISSGQWHEESFRNTTTGTDERHRARVQAFFNGKNYVGDREDGRIYEISTTTYTDDTNVIIRKRISPVVWNALNRVFYKSIQFDVQTGVGLVTGQGSDPKLVYSHSNDAGHTYGNEDLLSIGKMGQYRVRVKKNRLGAARARVFQITYSEPTAFTLFNAFAEFA